MITIWREFTDIFLCPKNKNLNFASCEEIYRSGEMIVFCVVFCRSVIVLFLLAIVLPALALWNLKTLLALFLKQVRKFTWLDPKQGEKIRVQFSIGFNLVWKLVCNIMSLDNKWSKKKLVCNFTSLDTKWSMKKPRTCNFTLPLALQALGPIGYDCYRSLWNKLEKKVLEISN
jgi:hypothetical protein